MHDEDELLLSLTSLLIVREMVVIVVDRGLLLTYTPHILAEVTLELEVTSLRNRTTKPCKGRLTI